MKQYAFWVLLVFFIVPMYAYADIRITEVAWMGTATSQYSEWIELYNDGASPVNLAGWKLYEGDGGVLVFTFTKSIDAGDYLLLERTTASAPDAVPGINDEAGPFGGGGFANTGEDLVLKDVSGATVEELNYLSGWPAGDATTKHTMQWNGDEWITASPTPDAPTSGDSTGVGLTDTPESKPFVDPDPIPVVSPNKPHIEFVVPKMVYVGMAYEYKARPVFEYNYTINEGVFNWNMGDGRLYTQSEFAPFVHTYVYPGTYTISFQYTDPLKPNNTLSGTQKVSVRAPSITISIKDNHAIELNNTSATEVNLTGWSFNIGGTSIGIPKMTILAERSTIALAVGTFSIPSHATVLLIDPSGGVVASSNDSKVAPAEPSSSYDDAPYESPDLQEVPSIIDATSTNLSQKPIQNRTKVFIFGAVALFVIVLSILLERVMARQEYS